MYMYIKECVYIYIHIKVCVCVCVYIYIYKRRPAANKQKFSRWQNGILTNAIQIKCRHYNTAVRCQYQIGVQ